MKVLTVVTHPRENSFTFAVTEKFVQGLRDSGHEAEILDLNIGMADYSGIKNSRVEFFYDTLEGRPEHMESLLERAYQLGLHYADFGVIVK
jgi:putative NADPH-quinone reductase